MKLFDHHSFLTISVTAYQAMEIADTADSVLSRASFVLYGTYVDGDYLSFSSKQKPGDTHVLLAYAPKRMKDSY